MKMLPDTSRNVDSTKFMSTKFMRDDDIGWKERLNRQSNDYVLLKMLEEGLHTDVILTAQGRSVKAHQSVLSAQGRSVKAHQIVLSAASPVFRAMFEHDMREKLSSTVDIPDDMREKLSSTVDIPDMTIEALQLFLLVLYTINEHLHAEGHKTLAWVFQGGIDKHFNEFFVAVAKYRAFRNGFKPLLEKALRRNLNPDNCWVYYDISLQFTEKSISSVVHDYIVDNFDKVVHSKSFLLEMRLIPNRVYSILTEVHSSGESSVKIKKARQV